MRRRTCAGCSATSKAATSTRPEEGGSIVVSIFMRVLLPAPFGPMRPKISAAFTVKETLSTAVSLSKRRVKSKVSITGAWTFSVTDFGTPSLAMLSPCEFIDPPSRPARRSPSSGCLRRLGLMHHGNRAQQAGWVDTDRIDAESGEETGNLRIVGRRLAADANLAVVALRPGDREPQHLQ